MQYIFIDTGLNCDNAVPIQVAQKNLFITLSYTLSPVFIQCETPVTVLCVWEMQIVEVDFWAENKLHCLAPLIKAAWHYSFHERTNELGGKRHWYFNGSSESSTLE